MHKWHDFFHSICIHQNTLASMLPVYSFFETTHSVIKGTNTHWDHWPAVGLGSNKGYTFSIVCSSMDASSRNGTSNFKLRSYNSVPAELKTQKRLLILTSTFRIWSIYKLDKQKPESMKIRLFYIQILSTNWNCKDRIRNWEEEYVIPYPGSW